MRGTVHTIRHTLPNYEKAELVMLAYQAPAILFNKHLETIYPALLRSVKDVNYTRERITTPDNDFWIWIG